MHRSSKLSRCLFALAFFAAGAPLQTAPCSPGHLQAAADINNADGLLTFRDNRGNDRLENSFGGVEVAGNTGDVVVINNNSFVNVTQVEGALSLRNRFGNVKVIRIT